jgi:ketosteroid isomerase-like protein
MEFRQLLDGFTAAVEAGDGEALASVFTEDGQYHDVFYGTFAGREAIARMLENYFCRDAEAFKWEMLDAVDDGRTGYARWRFSYTAKIEASRGRRIFMEGVGYFRLRDGLIESYEDYARIGEVLVQLGLPEAKTLRVLAKMAAAQNAKPEAAAHLEVGAG